MARPTPVAPAAILEDLDTGQVLFEKASHQRRPIASLTKIMTAILVLERAGLGERTSVSATAVAQSGDDPPLAAGETLSVRALLYAMLLPSSNDAAVALAEHVAGTSAAFVALMNRRAAAMGLRDTHFVSPSGFDSSGYSSAADVAALTRTALRDPTFAEVVRTYVHRLPPLDGRPRTVENRNLLLWYYPGAVGVKTGYLPAAGHCLVAAADRDGTRLVTVVLGHPDTAFGDGALLLDYGYRGFTRTTVIRIRQPVGVVGAGGTSVRVVAGGELSALVALRPPGHVEAKLVPRAHLPPDLRPGDRVGRVQAVVDGRVLGAVPAVVWTPSAASGPSAVPLPVAEPSWEGVLRPLGIVAVVLREMVGAFL
ncbi:MAG TPA: D-alanyl-D-alanine carboxypeptidase family protein [Myxococcaceae bacterium]